MNIETICEKIDKRMTENFILFFVYPVFLLCYIPISVYFYHEIENYIFNLNIDQQKTLQRLNK